MIRLRFIPVVALAGTFLAGRGGGGEAPEGEATAAAGKAARLDRG